MRRLTALLVALAASACVGGGSDTLAWRDARLELPDGWSVFEDETSRLSISNVPLGADVAEEDRPEGDIVAMFFTHEPGARPADWRDHIAASGATLEVDETTEVGGVPATRLQFLTPASGGIGPTRELVVLVPAREIVILAQPVPLPGDADAPQVFERGAPDFEAVLGSITWGAPYEDAPT